MPTRSAGPDASWSRQDGADSVEPTRSARGEPGQAAMVEPASVTHTEPDPTASLPPTTVSTRRVLFGHLHTEDAASAIARRLRTAIGLGVLGSGDRLPKEADLAQQLGVTIFSLREALGILRGEGLIVTRVGKNGGSYVAQPPAGMSMAGEELVQLSAVELRDLGDWRAALTTFAARLAARRAAVSTGQRLADCAQEMAAATSPAGARRALGRFHVELAAGSQSMRLTRAELALHDEFDWLAQVLLQDGDQRQGAAARMLAVASAVGEGDQTSASLVGEQMVSHLVTELMRVRLRMIAAQPAQTIAEHTPGAADLTDLPGAVRQIFGRTVATLQEMTDELSTVLTRRRSAAALNADVVKVVMPRLGSLDEVIHGLGFMAEIGVRPEAPYWMEWWQRAADGAFDRDYRHQLDPRSDDFYDYAPKGFMTAPRETGAATAMGPYVDYGGVDDNVVTVAVPVLAGAEFAGIMAADIRVAVLERALSPWLATADGICLLLNAESRVLVSNSVGHNAGDIVPNPASLKLSEVGCFGWQLGRAD